MARKKDYIPRSVLGFYIFQKALVAMVVLMAVPWGIDPTAVAALLLLSTNYDPVYNAITNKKNRTAAQVDAHTVYVKDYKKKIREFVKAYLIFNPLISHDQKVQMGLNPATGTSGNRPGIQTTPVVGTKAMDGGKVKIGCRVATDSNRTSRHPDSDGVELRYAVVVPAGITSLQGYPPFVTLTAPRNVMDCGLQYFSSKASFVLNFQGVAGCILYIYARWKNNTDDSKSGAFTFYGCYRDDYLTQGAGSKKTLPLSR